MRIKRIVCGLYGANAYLIYREASDQAVLIDAGDDLDGILDAAKALGKHIGAVILTHGHFDHILAAPCLRERTGARIYVHEADGAYLTQRQLNMYDASASKLGFLPFEADERIATAGGEALVNVCGYDLRVISTPGHTPGSICVMCGAQGLLFTGDTLFAQGYGRMDLPGGDESAMARSLQRLTALRHDLKVYPGHGPSATMAEAGRALW